MSFLSFAPSSAYRRSLRLSALAGLLLCATGGALAADGPETPKPTDPPFVTAEYARFNRPWAMTFLPSGKMLVTEKPGHMWLFTPSTRTKVEVSGLPAIAYGDQGGLGDVVLHPKFSSNRLVYFSYAEAGPNNTRGAVVACAKLLFDAAGKPRLADLRVLWRQVPKVTGYGQYGYRILFGPAGKMWITSGDRQKEDPAQDLDSNMGKVIRLNDDGSVPADNPFVGQGEIASQVWTLGHRNPYGLVFDAAGRLWEHEMGPAGGDELNLIVRGANYGWPIVSNGDNYDGSDIPNHDTHPEFDAPKAWWTPVIAPAGFIIYNGTLFPGFRGDGLIGGLASQSLVRIRFNGTKAHEFARYFMGNRIREVEQGPAGAIWLLEDDSNGRLLKLTPKPAALQR